MDTTAAGAEEAAKVRATLYQTVGQAGQTSNELAEAIVNGNGELWPSLSDDEFIEVIRACAVAAPAAFLNSQAGAPSLIDLIEARLQHHANCAELVSDIIYRAARHAADHRMVAADVLARLTGQHKRLLLREFDGYSLEFLTRTASQLAQGRQLFKAYVHRLCAISPDLHLEFCDIQPLLASMKDRALAAHIDKTLAANLAERGFRIGYLTIGKYKRWSQYEVVVKQNNRQFVYAQAEGDQAPLCEGDRVIFDTAAAKMKHRSVRMVRFHLLTPLGPKV